MQYKRNDQDVTPQWGDSFSGAEANFRVIDGPGTSATFEATTTHEFKADNDTGDKQTGVYIKYKLTIYRQAAGQGIITERVVEHWRNFNVDKDGEYTHVDLENRDTNPLDNEITFSVDMIDGVAYWCEAYTTLQKGTYMLQITDTTDPVYS